MKVVYAGFLLPFGHKASLVKVTERKLKPRAGGQPGAYLFQRMFIIVREPRRTFEMTSRAVRRDRRLDLRCRSDRSI